MYKHPLYSPYLALLDFHLSSFLKAALRGQTLTSDEELKTVVPSWLTTQPKITFYISECEILC